MVAERARKSLQCGPSPFERNSSLFLSFAVPVIGFGERTRSVRCLRRTTGRQHAAKMHTLETFPCCYRPGRKLPLGSESSMFEQTSRHGDRNNKWLGNN